MNINVDWPTYLRLISDDAGGRAIATKTGMPESSISRWLSGQSHPRPRQAITVARAYDSHPVQALVAAGYLNPSDIDLSAATPRKLQLRDFTDLELAEEMVRRVADGPSAILQAPLDGDHPAMNNVTRLPHPVPTEEEALKMGAVADTGVKEVAEFEDGEDGDQV